MGQKYGEILRSGLMMCNGDVNGFGCPCTCRIDFARPRSMLGDCVKSMASIVPVLLSILKWLLGGDKMQ